MLTSLSRSILSTSSVPDISADITSPGIRFLLRPGVWRRFGRQGFWEGLGFMV